MSKHNNCKICQRFRNLVGQCLMAVMVKGCLIFISLFYIYNIHVYFLPGVDNKNDNFRRYLHRKINRWDAQPPPCREEPGMFAGTQNFNRDKDSGKQLVAKKYPQSLVPEINEGPHQWHSANPSFSFKKSTGSITERMEKLKLTELVYLLTEMLAYQTNLPNKPRKEDVLKTHCFVLF